jgi:MFS family permease
VLRKLALDWSPLRSANFRRLWLAQTVSFIGSEIGLVTVSYQVYQLTGSSLAVGLLSLAQLVPMLTLTIIGGSFADTFDRRRLMLLQQVGMIVGTSFTIVNAALPHPKVWPCYAAMLLASSAYAFGVGAQNALIPRIVGDDQLAAANTLNSVVGSLGAVVGPALAGALLGTVGVLPAYILDTATFFATLVAVWFLPALPPDGGDERPSFRSIATGFRFLLGNRVILGFMLIDSNAMIFGMPTALFPAIAAHHFHHAGYVGYLFAGVSAGAFFASALGGWLPRVQRQGLVVVIAAAVWGGAIAAFGFATNLWPALVLLAIAGAGDEISAIMRGTMLLQLTPDSLRGRLIGIEFAQVTSTPALGNFEAGLVASLTSVRTAVVSGGLACVAGCAVIAALFPALIAQRRERTATA